ncbi:MAG: TSUP family transporter, partial [Acidobacteriota bacterium]
AVVLLAVGMSAFGLRVRRTNWSLLGAGAMSGFMSTTASIGGPPMAILYHDTPGARVRGTLSSFFVVGATFSLVALVAVGRFGWGELVAAVSLLPGILLGFAVSSHTARLVDRGYTRKAVLAVSALAGLSVILRELV